VPHRWCSISSYPSIPTLRSGLFIAGPSALRNYFDSKFAIPNPDGKVEPSGLKGFRQ
jgi:hypothetical protein